jgi:hypothetical protein
MSRGNSKFTLTHFCKRRGITTWDLADKRSTIGYVFTVVGGPICWRSMIQSIVAMSTTNAEYMAAAKAPKEALWLRGLVREMGLQ